MIIVCSLRDLAQDNLTNDIKTMDGVNCTSFLT